MTFINDATGNSGLGAKVGGNRLFTQSVTETEDAHGTEEGDSYNLNTGLIGLTSSTESTIMYLKNNEDRDLKIDAIAIGVSSAGTTTDSTTVTIVRNPTSVDFSTNADMISNRNFGSSKTLTADVFKGVEGSTATGGTDLAMFLVGSGTRMFAAINLILTKGDSIAIQADTQTSSGTTNIYAALVIHLKDLDISD